MHSNAPVLFQILQYSEFDMGLANSFFRLNIFKYYLFLVRYTLEWALVWLHFISLLFCVPPEFRLFFPQLTGVLTLAFFIHNCIITLMKSNRNQENNVSHVPVPPAQLHTL